MESNRIYNAAIDVRNARNQKKMLEKIEKENLSIIKDQCPVGLTSIKDVLINVTEVQTKGYSALDIHDHFSQKLIVDMMLSGVFKVDTKAFEDWAEMNGWDISQLKTEMSSHIRVLIS